MLWENLLICLNVLAECPPSLLSSLFVIWLKYVHPFLTQPLWGEWIMSVLSIVMLVASNLFPYLVIRNINKNNILFEQAFMWIVISLVMIVISVFDFIPDTFKLNYLDFWIDLHFLLSLTIFSCWSLDLQTMTCQNKRTDKAFKPRIIYFKSRRDERGMMNSNHTFWVIWCLWWERILGSLYSIPKNQILQSQIL